MDHSRCDPSIHPAHPHSPHHARANPRVSAFAGRAAGATVPRRPYHNPSCRLSLGRENVVGNSGQLSPFIPRRRVVAAKSAWTASA